jgi:hypothetical protein
MGRLYQVNNSVTFTGKSIGAEKFLNRIGSALGIIIDKRHKVGPRKMEG